MMRNLRAKSWISICILFLLFPISSRGGSPPVNVSLEGRALFGPTEPRTVAYDPATNHVFIGFRHTLAILTGGGTTPSLLGWLDLSVPFHPDTCRIYGIDYPGSGNYIYVTQELAGFHVIDITDPAHPTIAGSLSGLGSLRGVDVQGGYAFVAGTDGLRVLDVSDPANPTSTELIDPLSGASDVVVQGAYAYMTGGIKVFGVVNVSDPTNPVLAGSIQTPGFSEGVAVAGSYAYFTEENVGLRVVNVSNPASPVIVGTYGTSNYCYDVYVTGNRAFLLDVQDGLLILDVSIPASPSLLGSYDTPGFAYGVVAKAPYAYIADGWGGLHIVDVSSPTSPIDAGAYMAPGGPVDLVVQGNYAYIASRYRGVFISDVSSPGSSRIVGYIDLPGEETGVAVAGSHIYVAAQSSGLHVVDVSDPATPSLVATWDSPGTATRVAVAGDYAYLADGSSGLQIVDISDPAAPSPVGSLDTPGSAEDISLYDSHAYVADGFKGLQIIDVTDPSNPVLDGLFTGGWIPTVCASGDHAYLGRDIVDVTDPGAPVLAGTYSTIGYAGPVVGNISYRSEEYGTLFVDDVSNHSAPTQVGSYDTEGYTRATAFSSGYAYLADEEEGVYILHYSGQCFDEYEPNDFLPQPWPIDAGASYSPIICYAGDDDWFSLTVTESGVLSVTMQPPTGLDYDLFLYDPSGTPVAESSASGDTAESLIASAPAAGTWRALVRGKAGAFDFTTPYSLSWQFTPCAVPVDELTLFDATFDPAGDVIFHMQDPNLPAAVTGYNIYRAPAPDGPFSQRAQNVPDADPLLPDVQFLDTGSNDGNSYFYLATAANGTCGAEGPGAP